MINIARKYPFLFLLPTLTTGIITGDNISLPGATPIYATTTLIILSATLFRKYSHIYTQTIIPITTFLIGILAASINISELFGIESTLSNIKIFNQAHQYFIGRNRLSIQNPVICALTNAITLGDKSELTPEIKRLFAKCGIMHIVAVSGLHVGAIYLMVQKLFRFLRTPILQSKITAIIFIWLYSIVIGIPPSVLRAAAILTYMIIGEMNNKSFSSLNGIMACAFFTLIIAPENLYNLSFQLSYAAYIGIILLFPIFAPAKKGGNKHIKKIIASIGVSVAAQLLTTPITLHYFHGTSINSFILNIVVVPLTSLLLYCDLFTLLTPQPISLFLGKFTELSGMAIIKTTELIEPINIYIDNIYMSEATILLYYTLLFALFAVLPKTTHKF